MSADEGNRPTSPKISVIVPTYNRAQLLAEALDSLVAQTYKNFEVIVSDDGSTDATRAVVASFEGKLELTYVHGPNWGGPARPRNLAVDKAKGEWLAFLDADDIWYPLKLETVVRHFKQCDLIYHWLDVFTDSNTRISTLRVPQIDTKNVFRELMLYGNRVPHSSMCVRTEIFRELGGFHEDRQLIAVEDYDFCLRVASHTQRWKRVRRSLGGYRITGNQISTASPRFVTSLQSVVGLHRANLKRTEQRLADGHLNYVVATQMERLGQLDEACRLYRISAGTAPLLTRAKALLRLVAAVQKLGASRKLTPDQKEAE